MGRLPIPRALKRVLVPLWNEAHRLGWIARDYVSACVSGRWERCTVCGHFRPMLDRRRYIPRRLEELWQLTPRLASALARKETSECAGCGAKLRGRRMALVLLETCPHGDHSPPPRSLAEWARSETSQRLRIAEINRIDGVHEQLLSLPGFRPSDFQPEVEPGEMSRGVRCEDLTRLTYSDKSFDLVLTSETLEHVPDLDAALSEIYRVLTPGGRHVFTIPVLPGVSRTFARMTRQLDGTLKYHAQRICHPGGDDGYPVFTEFGTDIPEILRKAGFEVSVFFGPVTEDDLAQVYVCRRPDTELLH
jgi:SAM-dependent methyltransferase